MSEKNDFIQLPPIKKDTSSDVVAFIWEYMKIPENSREDVYKRQGNEAALQWCPSSRQNPHGISSPHGRKP